MKESHKVSADFSEYRKTGTPSGVPAETVLDYLVYFGRLT